MKQTLWVNYPIAKGRTLHSMLIWLYRAIYLLNVHFSRLDMLTPITPEELKKEQADKTLVMAYDIMNMS